MYNSVKIIKIAKLQNAHYFNRWLILNIRLSAISDLFESICDGRLGRH